MTSPFPQIQQGPVIQDPGLGGTLAQSLAQVLAQQQQQKENEYRQQQLAIAQQQQQSLAQYYQGEIANQQAETQAKTAEAAARSRGQREVGGAMRQYLSPQQQTAQPTPQAGPQRGNLTQAAQPGMSPAMVPGQPTTGVFQDVLQGGAAALAPAQGHPDIFGGVSDENLPAAVEGISQAQGIMPQPKEPELPTAGKEFMFAQELAKIDPKMAKFFIDNWVNKGPGTVVNVNPGESAHSKALAESEVDRMSQKEKDADLAENAISGAREAYRLVDKSFTGFGANAALKLARIAGMAGFKPASDKAENTQVLMKYQREVALSYLQTRAAGSGTAVSDEDRRWMEGLAGADITQEPNAIRRIIRVNAGIGIEKMEKAVAEIRAQAAAYPKDSVQLYTKARALQARIDKAYLEYGKMKQGEGMHLERIMQVIGQ